MLRPAFEKESIMAANNSEETLEGFPIDGRPWRIDAVGLCHLVAHRATPMVDVQFSGRDKAVPEYRVVEVSVALWPRLVVGRTYINGVKDKTAKERGQRVSLPIFVSQEAMRVVKWFQLDPLYESYIVPPYRFKFEKLIGSAYALVLKRNMNDKIGDLVVPCAEVCRAYFGQYAAVVLALLTGAFVEPPELRLFDRSRSKCVDRHAVIQLGKCMPDRAAQSIARPAFDPVAWKVAHNIARHATAASDGGRFPVIAYPPFYGAANWTVQGEPVGTKQHPRFLVHRLISCDAPLPFDDLVSYRDNPGDSENGESADPQLIIERLRAVASGNPFVVANDVDPGTSLPPIVLLDADDAVEVRTVPYKIMHGVNPTGSVGRQQTQTRVVPVRRGAAGHTVGTSPVVPVECDVKLEKTVGDPLPGSPAFFARVIDAIRESDEPEVAVLSESTTSMKPPGRPHRRSWAFVGGTQGKHQRSVMVVHLLVNEESFTLLEFERRRPSEGIATWCIFDHPKASELWSILEVYARGNGSPRTDDWKAKGLERLRLLSFRHPQRNKEASPESYARRILRRLQRAACEQVAPPMEATNKVSNERLEIKLAASQIGASEPLQQAAVGRSRPQRRST